MFFFSIPFEAIRLTITTDQSETDKVTRQELSSQSRSHPTFKVVPQIMYKLQQVCTFFHQKWNKKNCFSFTQHSRFTSKMMRVAKLRTIRVMRCLTPTTARNYVQYFNKIVSKCASFTNTYKYEAQEKRKLHGLKVRWE